MSRPEYYVRYVSLPRTVEGVTLPNDDGTYDIYINESLSEPRRRQVLEHELRHVNGGHFYTDRAVTDLEREAGGDDTVPRIPNIFRLPDRDFIPAFQSLASLQTYLTALHEDLTRAN